MSKIENKLAEIIGKKEDYTLEDVLVALEDVIWGRKFYLFEIWRLNKPLHEQSEKTINFLNNLL